MYKQSMSGSKLRKRQAYWLCIITYFPKSQRFLEIFQDWPPADLIELTIDKKSSYLPINDEPASKWHGCRKFNVQYSTIFFCN